MHQATLRPDLGVRLILRVAGKPYNQASLMISKPVVNKAQYTETEAAQQLGVSVEELRVLIRRHIVVDDADSGNVPMTAFQPSDLLVLRLMRKAGSVSQVA